jgi:hypothetical protein
MTKEQLERQRESVKAQLRWAMLHDGDRELLELLRCERGRLSAMIGQMSPRACGVDRQAARGCSAWWPEAIPATICARLGESRIKKSQA